MRPRIIIACIAVSMLAGCASLQRSEWVKANGSAKQVYGDTNMEVWNMGDRCYYFLKRQLKYVYQCGHRNTVQERRKPPVRYYSAGLSE